MEKKNSSKKLYILVIAIIVFLFIFLYFKSIDITFALYGENPQIIKYGDDYYENGCYATNGFGTDLRDNIVTNGQINTYQEGSQRIEYVLKFAGITKKLTREVIVLENAFKGYDFYLNGDSIIYLVKGDNYEEQGAYVVKQEGNITYNDIEIKGNVNTSIPNEYEIIYSFTLGENTMTKKRKVIVLEKNEEVKLNSDGKSAVIRINFSNIDNYSKTILPDGKVSAEKEIEYTVKLNGEYHFLVYNNEKLVFDKKVLVDSLANSLTCIGEVKVSGTFLNIITDTPEIKKIVWNIDGTNVDGTKEIHISNRVSKASTDIEFTDGTKVLVNCKITDNLAYTFTYDEYNTKPYIACKTYTEQDRINLEAKLKKAVDDAGYGTRAGVVEAARFLVGGLDYKIRYLGPKKVNSTLGRYTKSGLNIANSNGWGCSVSGWTQGMDCTNFVKWAFAQNGLDINDYYNKSNTYKTKDSVGNIRVGDFLLTPCTTRCENRDYMHVGIVIGIDDKNIYVAEATTESTDAIVVSKYNKFNMPASGKFSVFKKYIYANDGNVTDMWMS